MITLKDDFYMIINLLCFQKIVIFRGEIPPNQADVPTLFSLYGKVLTGNHCSDQPWMHVRPPYLGNSITQWCLINWLPDSMNLSLPTGSYIMIQRLVYLWLVQKAGLTGYFSGIEMKTFPVSFSGGRAHCYWKEHLSYGGDGCLIPKTNIPANSFVSASRREENKEEDLHQLLLLELFVGSSLTLCGWSSLRPSEMGVLIPSYISGHWNRRLPTNTWRGREVLPGHPKSKVY